MWSPCHPQFKNQFVRGWCIQLGPTRWVLVAFWLNFSIQYHYPMNLRAYRLWPRNGCRFPQGDYVGIGIKWTASSLPSKLRPKTVNVAGGISVPSGLTGVRSLPPQFERQPRRVRKGDCYACTCHSESSRDIIRRGESNTPFTTPRESTLVDILGESTVSDPHDQTLV